MMHRRRFLALLVAPLLASACSGGGATTTADEASSVRGDVVVLAASSLKGVLATIARRFEAAHPGVHVRLTLDGSARLAAEILQGVPADLFIAADDATMTRVRVADRVRGATEVVATNELSIVVSTTNPRGVRSIDDLTRGATVALCRSEVPCGAYAERAFRRAGLTVPAAGREDSVKAVLAKVQLGEADAGIVYRTDLIGATGVRGVVLPASINVRTSYPAAVLGGAPNQAAAVALFRYLRTSDAQGVFAQAGFGPP